MTLVQQLLDRKIMRVIAIGVGLQLVQQFTGVNAVMFYVGKIFSGGKGVDVDTAISYSVIVAVVQVVSTFVSCLLTNL